MNFIPQKLLIKKTLGAPILVLGLVAALFFYQSGQVDAQSNLNGACVSSPQSVMVGEPVTFTAEALGGTGQYSFVWSGSEGLSGVGQSLTKTFETSGTKTARVFITSGGQTVTPECVVEVSVTAPGLTGSCFPHSSRVPAGSSVVWTAQVSGGEGRPSYSWSGTDDLSGRRRSITESYSTPGIKTARVLISAGNQSMIRTCTVTIVPNPALEVSCSPDFSTTPINRGITWTAQVSGGTGQYSYSWTGTDGLSGSNQAVSHSYTATGLKTATVHVVSGDQGVTASCNAQVASTVGIIEDPLVPEVPEPPTPIDDEPTHPRPVDPREAAAHRLDLGAGFLSFIFIPILILWAILVIYIVKQRRNTDKEYGGKRDTKKELEPEDHLEEEIEERTRESKVLISAQGLKLIKDQSGGDKEKALSVIDKLIEKKKKTSQTDESEWDILDTNEIKKFIDNENKKSK